MMKQTLAAVSLLATALACAATFGQSPGTERSSRLRATAEEQRAAPEADPAAPLMAANDDLGIRVTPVVRAVRRAADSVVSIYLVDRRVPADRLRADGQGSGVILDDTGFVITNWHVVARALGNSPLGVLVRLKNDVQYQARIVSTSADEDLALLQLQLPAGETVQPIDLGDSSSLMTGETLIAIGNPQGHANTVTVGVLSATDRSITVRAPDGIVRTFEGLLQTDAAINQGNSGGALLDLTGKLIGINNAMAAGAENIGFAIPVDTVKRVFQDKLLSSDFLGNVWIGMQVDEQDGRVVVASVDPAGPADRAGIRRGDVVVSTNGRQTSSQADYARGLLTAQPGQALPLALLRRGDELEVEAVPLTMVGLELVRRAGIEVETLTRSDDEDLVRRASQAWYAGRRRVYWLPSVVRITRVYPDGPAADLGLQRGDIMLGFYFRDVWRSGDVAFRGAQDLADTIRSYARRDLPIYVLRDDEQLDGDLRPR
ncbi:MAG: trypsin-like peptidase domain-containing protein [Planctomycetota bacterium]